jgi:hypothetical protein
MTWNKRKEGLKMKDKLYVGLGSLFLIFSGLIYTIERATLYIGTSLVIAGFHAGSRTGEVPQPEFPSFADNIFVPIFTIIGIAFFYLGFLNDRRNP